jgi:hypothetical protein
MDRRRPTYTDCTWSLASAGKRRHPWRRVLIASAQVHIVRRLKSPNDLPQAVPSLVCPPFPRFLPWHSQSHHHERQFAKGPRSGVHSEDLRNEKSSK